MTQPPSKSFARCPWHYAHPAGRNGGLTGLIHLAKDVLVFRDHTKTIGQVTIPCPGSGKSPTEKKEDNK